MTDTSAEVEASTAAGLLRAIRPHAIALIALLVTALIVGSFADETISRALFGPENAFGVFLAAWGETPALLSLVAAGTLLIVARNRARTPIAVVQLIGGGLLVALGAAGTTFQALRYIEIPIVALVVIGAALVAPTVLLFRTIGRRADHATAVRVGLAFFLVVIVEIIVVNVMKQIWQRPRMRLLEEDPSVAFQPWWQIGSDDFARLTAEGVSWDEFASFPSGHTANGAVLILVVLLALLVPRLTRFVPLLWWIGAIGGLLVAMSRIITGAHFVTDTVGGYAVALISVLVAIVILQRREVRAERVSATP